MGTTFSILIAGASAVVIGMVWFHPKIFGATWVRMQNLTPAQVEQAKRRMPIHGLVEFLAALLVASVLLLFERRLGVTDAIGAMQLALICWLGFTAPPMLGMVLWEQKPPRAYLLVALNWLVTFLVMSVILLY